MSQPSETGGSKRDPAPERLGVAGSGTIACGLAAAAAGCGVDVTLWARSDRSLDRAKEAVGDGVAVAFTRDLDALAQATVAVEAVLEEPGVKEGMLRSLAGQAGDRTLLASTTSSLSIERLARESGLPERFFGFHVFNPVNRMKLVELCFPDEATDDTRSRSHAFCLAIDKTAVEVPDEAGFVVNRLLFPFLFDAVRLLERTGLEPAQIDTCMKLGVSHPMGPLELLDLVGLDVAESIGEALYADSGEPGHRPPGRIKSLVREGRLGRKSGAGFHEYT